MTMRGMTYLNSCGDSTIAWTEEHDMFWVPAIQAMMDRGVTFFIIEDRGLRRPLKSAADAPKSRHLAMVDVPEPAMALLEQGKADVVASPPEPVRPKRRAKTAKEAAEAQTVAVQPRAGG